MADGYAKETVATLRGILKERGIPSTGLTRKQQIIEKLEQWDDENATQEAGAATAATDHDDDDAAAAKEAEENEQEQASPATIQGEKEGTSEAASSVTMHAEEAENGADDEEKTLLTEDEAPTPAQTETQGEQPVETAQAESQPEPELEEKIEAQPAPQQEPQTDAQTDAEVAPQAESQTKSQPEGESGSQEEPATAATQAPEGSTKGASPAPNLSVSQTPVPTHEPAVPDAAKEATPTTKDNAPASVTHQETASSTASVAPTRVPSQELADDRKKRKRRSPSPPVTAEDVQRKRAKQNEEIAPEVHLREDVMMDAPPPEESEETKREATVKEDTKMNTETAPEQDTSAPAANEGSKPHPKDSRFQGLFSPQPAQTSSTPQASDRDVSPAIHVATPALYMKDFMRPLQEKLLRDHLVALASPPDAAPDPNVLKVLHLDAYRTHCLALFESTTCAARVRAAMHGTRFPNEPHRRVVWVDFVPEDRVQEWIDIEEDDAREAHRGMGKKWEVVYEANEDGTMEAIFRELGGRGSGPSLASRLDSALGTKSDPPTGPRAGAGGATQAPRRPSTQAEEQDGSGIHPSRRNLIEPPHRAAPPPPSRQQHQPPANQQAPNTAASFNALDALFPSTTAKPKLYYKPVSQDIVEARQAEFDRVFANSRPVSTRPGPGDGLRKWSFASDSGRFVDSGGLFRPAYNRGGGGRGGRGDRGAGGGRGGGAGGRAGGDFYRS